MIGLGGAKKVAKRVLTEAPSKKLGYTGTEVHYVYALLDPRCGSPFYVGTTTSPERRLRGHSAFNKGHHGPRMDKVMELREAGLQPTMEILEASGSCVSKWLEQWYIDLYESWGFAMTNRIKRGFVKMGSGGKEISKTPIPNFPEWLHSDLNDAYVEPTERALDDRVEIMRKNIESGLMSGVTNISFEDYSKEELEAWYEFVSKTNKKRFRVTLLTKEDQQ